MFKKIWDELTSKYGEDFDWGYWDSDLYFKELNNELTEKHPLYNNIECFVGKCFFDDDALYLKKNGRAVIVHLGWPSKKRKDMSGEFPTYTEFLDLKSAIEYIEKEFVESREYSEDYNKNLRKS